MKRFILALAAILCAVPVLHAEDSGAVSTGTQRFSGTKIWRDMKLTDSELTGATTLTVSSTKFQRLDPGGANRDVTLPAEENNGGMWFYIINSANAAENLVVKDDAGSTIVTIEQSQAAFVACSGSAWKGFAHMAVAAGTLQADGSVAGATGQAQDFGTNGIKADVIAESSGATGVTIDGLLIKDTTVDLNGTADALILDADGNTSISAPTGDTIDIEVAGADDFVITANTFTAVSGSTIATNTIAETTAASGVTVDSLVIKDGGATLGSSGTIDLNGEADALVLDADGNTSISSPTGDTIDIEVAGADDFTITANTFTAVSGSTIKTNTIAETTGANGVTFSHTANLPAVLGSDAALGITGAASGGTIVVAGGVGATDTAGGLVSLTGGAGDGTGAGAAADLKGGAGGATGVGGAASVTGGIGGATSGTGGEAKLTGGAGTNGNAVGGAATVAAGAGQGTGAGAIASMTGGASGAGATGNGGISKIVGGAALSTNGNGGAAQVTGGVGNGTGTGGALTFTSGASAGAGGTAGSITIDCGNEAAGTAGTMSIGTTECGAITIGRSGQTVTFSGNVARASQRIRYSIAGAKIGSAAGFTVGAASDIFAATCSASQTAAKLVIPIGALKVGSTITAFGLLGQIESGGNNVTVDADLRVSTGAASDFADASVSTMTQVSVNADSLIDSSDDKTGLSETTAQDDMYYIVVTVTTNASCDVDIRGVTLVVTEN